MSATITWVIEYMNTSLQTINGFQEVVLTAGWRCNGSEDNATTPPLTFTSSVYGSASFVPPQAGDPNFTPYNQLTQDQVLGWVWASGVDKTATEAAVQANLNAQINPTQAQLSLPWATPAQPAAPAA